MQLSFRVSFNKFYWEMVILIIACNYHQFKMFFDWNENDWKARMRSMCWNERQMWSKVIEYVPTFYCHNWISLKIWAKLKCLTIWIGGIDWESTLPLQWFCTWFRSAQSTFQCSKEITLFTRSPTIEGIICFGICGWIHIVRLIAAIAILIARVVGGGQRWWLRQRLGRLFHRIECACRTCNAIDNHSHICTWIGMKNESKKWNWNVHVEVINEN